MVRAAVARRHAELFAKTPAEVRGVVEAPLVTDLRDAEAEQQRVLEVAPALIQSCVPDVARCGESVIREQLPQVTAGDTVRGSDTFDG